MPRILVVDDDPEIRALLEEVLVREGLDVVTAEDGEAALARAAEGGFAAALVDVKMPKFDGMAVLAELRRRKSALPVIILTAFGDIPMAVEAMRQGAYDYVTKPFRNHDLLLRIEHLLERQTLLEEVQSLRGQLAKDGLAEQMGRSASIQRVIEQVALVAGSSFSVLIQGETGTGKELIARAVHAQSRRRTNRFVAVDCGAIPEALIESELFGYEKGAFTGADRRKDGQFQLAQGGTLFLDEIANLPATVQAKLLRALQERAVQPLGGREPLPVDVRVVAACNVALDAEMRSGRFRQDLYYRLSEFTITLPPLRERPEDIVHLAQRFLDEASLELRRPAAALSPETVETLLGYRWPGNARELRNVVRRAALLSEEVVTPAHLGVGAPGPREQHAALPGEAGLALSLKDIADAAVAYAERDAINQALQATSGNKSQAARLLQTDYKTLHLKMRRYGISAREQPDSAT